MSAFRNEVSCEKRRIAGIPGVVEPVVVRDPSVTVPVEVTDIEVTVRVASYEIPSVPPPIEDSC